VKNNNNNNIKKNEAMVFNNKGSVEKLKKKVKARRVQKIQRGFGVKV
jgi:hypothetical protein